METSDARAVDLARSFEEAGVSALIYTDIARDGMLEGIDPETLRDLEQLAELGPPVIASGGVTTLEDVRKLVELSVSNPRLTGAIVGRALYEGTLDLGAAVELTSA